MGTTIQLIDRREGLPPEEVGNRLSTGWLCISNVAVAGPALVTPGQPEPGKFVDVWLAPPYGAMMPQLAVAQALLIVEDKGGDIITLHDLARLWFNQSLKDLREALSKPPEDAENPPQAGE